MIKSAGRRWLSSALCRCVLSALGFSLLPFAGSTSAEVKHHFRIDAVALQQALVQFVSQSQLGVLVDEDVDTSLVVTAVDAQLDASAALQQMLKGVELVAEKNTSGYYVIRRRLTKAEPPSQRPRMEEVVVTGTYIKGGLGRSLNPVAVIDRAELQASGMPSMIDLVANLPAVSGTENQSNQFHNVNAAGTANINLRGLGVSRTLVLLNGKRMVQSALPHNDGQAYVDINTIPALALQQVEVLKDGAGATYGSDAMAGVVNFITRRDFDGVELQLGAKYLDEGDGDWDLGVLAGGELWQGRWLGTLSYSRRNELTNLDREDVVRPVVDIDQTQHAVYGVSAIGNPGAFIPVDAATALGGVTEAEANAAASGRDNYVRDPNCQQVGGVNLEEARCGFNYVMFDNLVEEQEHWQAFASWQLSLDETTEFYTEFNYAYLELPEWKTSPSYPPVKEVDSARFLPASHPALAEFVANHPGIVENDGDIADFSGGAIFVGRPIGVAGQPEDGWRSQQTLRLLSGLSGKIAADVDYDLSLTYATNLAESRTPDVLIDRWRSALQGFGGRECQGSLAGQNGCLYYNPFSSAIASSADYDPALANSPQLLNWLKEDLVQENTSELAVMDALFSGSFTLPRGITAEYAYGAQFRRERLKIRFDELGDVDINPGTASVPGELPGGFIFFRGGREDDVSQDVVAVFGELVLPLDDSLMLQLALRYEDYGGAIGHSLDPKLALRWDLTPALSLRASASTTFRAPSLNQTGLDTTTLELIGAAFAFKAVDRIGNPELAPEQASSYSVGLQWEADHRWRVKLDYWLFDFRDVIVQESANALVNTVLANPVSPYAAQVVFDGSGNISRILSRYVNGPDILVDGIDFAGDYSVNAFDGSVTLGWDIAYLRRYHVGTSDLLPSFAADGRLNTGTFVKALPKWQGKLYLNYQRERVNLRLNFNAIGSYQDDGLAILEQTQFESFVTEEDVDGFYTLDAHVSLQLPSQQTYVGLSLLNITDREPPAVREDMRFDTTLHNAFGRMVKLTLQHPF